MAMPGRCCMIMGRTGCAVGALAPMVIRVTGRGAVAIGDRATGVKLVAVAPQMLVASQLAMYLSRFPLGSGPEDLKFCST
mmetsp:Transcript_27745/g.41999  ORF Transcript_27745/g.41999 Transcript_27745/m.41999 type:complete len:80 (-) Transcript_27745:420-659(-)